MAHQVCAAYDRRSCIFYRLEVSQLQDPAGIQLIHNDRDEAFELGCQWANLYPEDSASRKLIDNIMSTSYLVNIVANDFKDGTSIFEPFDLKASNGSIHINGANRVNGVNGVNGAHANGLDGMVNGLKDALGSVTRSLPIPIANGNANGH